MASNNAHSRKTDTTDPERMKTVKREEQASAVPRVAGSAVVQERSPRKTDPLDPAWMKKYRRQQTERGDAPQRQHAERGAAPPPRPAQQACREQVERPTNPAWMRKHHGPTAPLGTCYYPINPHEPEPAGIAVRKPELVKKKPARSLSQMASQASRVAVSKPAVAAKQTAAAQPKRKKAVRSGMHCWRCNHSLSRPMFCSNCDVPIQATSALKTPQTSSPARTPEQTLTKVRARAPSPAQVRTRAPSPAVASAKAQSQVVPLTQAQAQASPVRAPALAQAHAPTPALVAATAPMPAPAPAPAPAADLYRGCGCWARERSQWCGVMTAISGTSWPSCYLAPAEAGPQQWHAARQPQEVHCQHSGGQRSSTLQQKYTTEYF